MQITRAAQESLITPEFTLSLLTVDKDRMPEELEDSLMSIVVPCFNVGDYIGKFLDSILEQDYGHIELILVNDGSTDKTGDVISQYLPSLRRRLLKVVVVEQENRGLAGAINSGLKLFSGEFLMWPDPDDWITPHSVRRRVELLQENPEVGLLRSNCQIYDQSAGDFCGYFLPTDTPVGLYAGLFGEIIKRETFTAPVSSTVRSSAFLEQYPCRTIFESRNASQNFQMLLPVTYFYPVLLTGESLGTYRVRADSRSRSARDPALLLQRHMTIHEVLQKTLDRMKDPKRELKDFLRVHYERNIFLPLYFETGKFDDALRLLRVQSLGGLKFQVLSLLVCVARFCGRSGALAVRLRRVFKRLIRYHGKWDEVVRDQS